MWQTTIFEELDVSGVETGIALVEGWSIFSGVSAKSSDNGFKVKLSTGGIFELESFVWESDPMKKMDKKIRILSIH